jgi:WXG100 family type VII secretion target
MSTSNSFITEVGTMTAAANHVNEVNSAITADLSNLRNRIEPIVGSWRGAGSQAFQALMQRYNENARQLNLVLADISEGIRTSGKRYDEQDNSVAADMTRALSQL